MRYDILIGQEHVSSRIVKTRQEYEILTLVYEFMSSFPLSLALEYFVFLLLEIELPLQSGNFGQRYTVHVSV